MDRDETIKEIKRALTDRSGKSWSVTGGKGTAWGWITINAPPARRTWHDAQIPGSMGRAPSDFEEVNTGQPGGYMSPDDRAELGRLLGKAGPVHYQGESIPAGHDYWREYIDRANGRMPTAPGVQYWD